MIKKIDMNLSNYYGCVEAFNDNGKCWIELDNYSGTDKVEISIQTWTALEIEFGSMEIEND